MVQVGLIIWLLILTWYVFNTRSGLRNLLGSMRTGAYATSVVATIRKAIKDHENRKSHG